MFVQLKRYQSLLLVTVIFSGLDLTTARAEGAPQGQVIYEQTCVACHGADGRGTLPGVPDFTASGSPLTQEDEILLRHITEGFQSPGSMMAMPPKGGNPDLTDEDVQNVLRYLRSRYGT